MPQVILSLDSIAQYGYSDEEISKLFSDLESQETNLYDDWYELNTFHHNF